MKKIYVCLAGNWVCLNDDPDSKISEYGKSPYCWWEEGAPIYSPCSIFLSYSLAKKISIGLFICNSSIII